MGRRGSWQLGSDWREAVCFRILGGSLCAVYLVNRLQINSTSTVVGPGAQTSLVSTPVREKQMLNKQLYIPVIYLKPMTNASNMRPMVLGGYDRGVGSGGPGELGC